MPLHSSAGPFYPLVSIAVNTTVDAAMIRTDIHAFHAAAKGALIGILFRMDGAAKNTTDLLGIDTGRMGNPIRGQVHRLRTGRKAADRSAPLCWKSYAQQLALWPPLPRENHFDPLHSGQKS